jgi:uncharacterized protein YabE (DUF348 family)
MEKKQKTSIAVIKIIALCLSLVILSGIGVMAVSTKTNSVKITLSNGYEMTVLTGKTKVSDILEENNIILQDYEKVTPGLDEEITANNEIVISDKSVKEIQVAKVSESGIDTTIEDILNTYATISEKIVVEQVVIPYETITKDTTNGSSNTTNKIIQYGKDGLKEVTYRVKYQNDEEIERTMVSEVVITEPVDKIVQVTKTVTSRSASTTQITTSSSSSTVTSGTVYKVTAYCSCSICCGKSASGYTASGTKATAGRTVAASSQFAFGPKLLINGQEYVVEDRGGAIKGNKIDIYMDSHAEALAWGVRYLTVQVVE